MSHKKYTIGIDFGTESGRVALVDISNGQEVATAVHPYANGMIDQHLAGSNKPLPSEGPCKISTMGDEHESKRYPKSN